MNPIKFKESNVIFAENQPEYNQLPAFKANDGQVITCWSLSLREKLRILFTGKVWLSLQSFNQPLTPSFMTTKKSDLFY